jgi:glycosyltransferase involved in cell wall biosynthesis
MLDALRRGDRAVVVDVRIVGGRSARRYARAIGARWVPNPPGHGTPLAWRSSDLVHLLGFDVPPPRRRPFVVNMYDLASVHFSDEAPLAPWATDTLARATRVITATRASAREIERMLKVPGDRIRVIPLGPGQQGIEHVEPLDEEELRDLGLTGPFVLRLGGYTRRKNVGALLAAWPQVRRETGAQLVLAGPPHPALVEMLAAAPSVDGVVVLDFVASSLIARLIRTACVLVSPSTYEGFGLPPLEAMRAGVPVVAVRSSAVEEVCGDAAILVDNSPEAIADGLERAISRTAEGKALIRRGLVRARDFTWEASADALVKIYEEL